MRERCPRCWSTHVRYVETVDGTNMLCMGCQRCWRFEMGYLVEVNPLVCPGCADPSLCRQR